MTKVKFLVYFICRMFGLFRLSLWLTRYRLRILCYHGFALDDETHFRPKLFITPDTFLTRLEKLRTYGFRVLSLDEAVERLRSKTLPKRSLVITIDDGFHSVRSIAAPALQRHGFPATVYVTTYYVEHANPIFRLAIQYMFWKTGCRSLISKDLPWAAETEINLMDKECRERATWDCIRYGENHCTEDERVEISRRMGKLLEVPYEDIENTRILHLMTPDELKDLGRMGVDIQLHTHRHVFPDDEARAQQEIADNRESLDRLHLDGDLCHFCYPSGLFSNDQWAWLDKMGIKSSTTCIAGLNSAKTARHALRRFLDGENINMLEFEANLSGFSELIRLRWSER